LAISPSRADANSLPKTVRLFGHFPGELHRDVLVLVNGKAPRELGRSTGNSLLVELPESIESGAGSRVKFQVRVRQSGGFLGWSQTWHEFVEYLAIGHESPFKCIIESFVENPNLLEVVKSSNPTSYEASTQGGANRPNENRTLLARDLFVASVAEPERYDIATVRVAKVGLKRSLYGGCGNQNPSASAVVEKSGSVVKVALRAPYKKFKVHTSGKWYKPKVKRCDKGGTKAIAVLKPEFKAAHKDTPTTIRKSVKEVTFGRSGFQEPYSFGAKGNWEARVRCSFDDSLEKWNAATMVLRSDGDSAVARNLKATLLQGTLLIEPYDSLEFEDGQVEAPVEEFVPEESQL
jgi:hypothetical protein